MDNIVADNGYAIGSIRHLNLLYALARERNERYSNRSFNEDDYKWILGIKVIHDLDMMCHCSYIGNINEPSTLFGIKVDIDYQNPYNVQLWENITDKL